MPQQDPRNCKTEALLQSAFIELISETCFSSITVEDIAARAKVNRATFYRHFQDKYNLAERIFDGAIQQMSTALADIDEIYYSLAVNPARLETPKAVVLFFERIRENPRLYRAILGCTYIPGFKARLQYSIEKYLRERISAANTALMSRLESTSQSIPFEVNLALVSSFFLECINWWLESDLRYSPEEVATWMRSFMFAGCLE